MIRRSYFFTKTDFFSAMYIWLFMLLSANVHAQIPSASLTKQQSIFLEAYDSLAINDRKAIAQYKRQLHSHPLSIYLDYHDYRIHIKNTHNARIKAFIRNHKNSYLSDKLYVHWLKSLAQKKALDNLHTKLQTTKIFTAPMLLHSSALQPWTTNQSD